MKGAKKRVEQFKKLEDGTYSAQTGKPVTYFCGYQFSFVRNEAYIQLNDDNWDILTEYIKQETGSEEHIGVYDGKAETSFYTENLEVAMRYAVKFNQESVLDWAALNEGKSWREIYIQNSAYDENEEVDYVKIIAEILQHEKKV